MPPPDDLWPVSFAPPADATPLSILREQAALLADKTGGLVRAEVVTTMGKGGDFVHAFVLSAPALAGCRHVLFEVWHTLDLYPVSTLDPEAAGEWELDDESRLRAFLRRRLVSEATRRVVGILMQQAAAAAELTRRPPDPVAEEK